MTSLADLHVHLCAGLDDGPRSEDDALAMCRIASEEGIRYAAALAHQSERWRVTPETIRASIAALTARLQSANIPLTLYASAEVMASPNLVEDWKAGRLLSIADTKRFLLVEMPHQVFVDLRPAVRALAKVGVRIILAHPERHPELLHESGNIDELIAMGCVVQVSTSSITDPANSADARALESWFRRGCVHLLGSDGHSPRKRRPLMADAYRRVKEWVGEEMARRIGEENGLAVLRGESLQVAPPRAERRWWSLGLW